MTRIEQLMAIKEVADIVTPDNNCGMSVHFIPVCEIDELDESWNVYVQETQDKKYKVAQKNGLSLFSEKLVEEEVEVTLDEIADKFGISTESLRIKE